jgi:putative acetyltransferase
MIIRTEVLEDYKAVFKINYLAFGKQEDESKLIERIRVSGEFIPELSIVAEDEGKIIGHILLSKAYIVTELEVHEVIVLAPVAVHPAYQKRGIGRKLIKEGLRKVKNMKYGLVLLIGHPTYYPKFGFKPARQFRLELRQFEVPDEVFMVCEMREGELNRIKGELKYPKAFLKL